MNVCFPVLYIEVQLNDLFHHLNFFLCQPSASMLSVTLLILLFKSLVFLKFAWSDEVMMLVVKLTKEMI